MSLSSLSSKCDKYEKYCSQEELPLFKEMRPALTRENYRLTKNAHAFYDRILKLIPPSNDEVKQRKFIRILEGASGKSISRTGVPQIILDFKPMILSLRKEREPSYHLETVDSSDPAKVAEAALAIDKLSIEGLGHSFGVYVYRSMIQSPLGLCLVAKDENNQIIGCVFGTLAELDGGSLKIFHVWTCVRKANHPGIHFIQRTLLPFEQAVIGRYKPDYLSLNVDEDNFAGELYKKAGFVGREKEYNSFSGKDSWFMTKNINPAKEPPRSSDVKKAIEQTSLRILGYATGLVCMINFKATNIFRNLWYQ